MEWSYRLLISLETEGDFYNQVEDRILMLIFLSRSKSIIARQAATPSPEAAGGQVAWGSHP
jgi:hypothetical protein